MTNIPAAASRSLDHLETNFALQLAALAVAAGLLADLLFNGAPLGLNVPLWLGALIGALVLAARRADRAIGRVPASLFAASFGLSLLLAWRSEQLLQLLLLATSASLLLFALVTDDDRRLRNVSITFFFSGLVLGALSAVQGAVLLPRALPWRSWLGQGASRQAAAIGRAALIALPLVLIFGALFFAADAVFEAWIKDAVAIDLRSLRRHVAWVFGGAIAAAGILWCGLATEQLPPSGPQLPNERRLRAIETTIVLGALASLFALFVIIQLRYLFSGGDHVLTSTGLTYAHYARRGFFELVAVAALLLPVLLSADWARTRNRRSLTAFRILGSLLVILLLVVVISAFQRMRIYMDAYGLTVLRLYVSTFLAWLAVVFGWLLWVLLRERRDQFVGGAVVTALLTLVVLVALNPHGTIVATNLERAEQGREFDTPHALGLSADATPTLVANIDLLPAEDACQIARTMLVRWGSPELELRSWNWGRAAARTAVESNREELQSACD